MKRLILVACLLFVALPTNAFSGEKEELQWQVKYYNEHMINLQKEAGYTVEMLKKAEARLKELEDAEKDGKKVKEGSEKKGVKR